MVHQNFKLIENANTAFKDNINFYVKGFDIYRMNRHDGKRGFATMIKNYIDL